jgi:SPX domain protein involved in polyphosphate accumulation
MLWDHRHQRSRYELKYLIDEPCARQVRDFVRSHLRRDPHARAAMRYSYPIYSLYLDDPGMGMFRAVLQGQKNRFKLRVRYYDHNGGSPLFCEIKRRVNEVILKRRAIIRRQALPGLLARCCPRPDDLSDPADIESLDVLREFFNLRNALHAEPRIIICYEREAWVSPEDENVRITFDRNAAAAHYAHSLEPQKWQDAKLPSVILELKFDDRFPLWMRELVQSFNLYRTTMGKYVHCVQQVPRAARPYGYVSA